MKQKQLTLYSGLVAGLSTPTTPAQEGLGISNKIQKYEPFVMTNSTDITQVGTLTKPTQRLTIGKNANGVAKTDLQEYATIEELQGVLNTIPGWKYVNTNNYTILLTDSENIAWYNSGANGTITLPSTASIPTGEIKRFTIYNRTPKLTGNGTQGFLGVYTGDLINSDPKTIIIPLEASLTFYAVKNGIWTSQNNRYVYRTTSNLEMDLGIGDKFYINYDANTASPVALGITLAGATQSVMQQGTAYSMIVRNANAQVGKYVVSMPTETSHYKGAASYDIAQGKAREFSVMIPFGSSHYYWQVSEELSNA